MYPSNVWLEFSIQQFSESPQKKNKNSLGRDYPYYQLLFNSVPTSDAKRYFARFYRKIVLALTSLKSNVNYFHKWGIPIFSKIPATETYTINQLYKMSLIKDQIDDFFLTRAPNMKRYTKLAETIYIGCYIRNLISLPPRPYEQPSRSH